MATSNNPLSIDAARTLQVAVSGAIDPPVGTANFPLKIIAPQAGLTTANRFYKAYPGFEYNVRMAVTGGVYPYVYELTAAPLGMTINSITGRIDWTAPAENTTPFAVSAKVTDLEGAELTVDWTVLVTTDGFVFVDSENGNPESSGATGTINDPWAGIGDFTGTTADNQYWSSIPDSFVYFRGRSTPYELDGFVSESGSDGTIMNRFADVRPKVWLGYPGDPRPIISLERAVLQFSGPGHNLCLDGLEFTLANQMVRGGGPIGIKVLSTHKDVSVSRCLFRDCAGGTIGGNNSLLFIYYGGRGENYAIQDNIFQDVDTGYGVLGYNSEHTLVEDNIVQGLTGTSSHGIGPKEECFNWTIRGNRLKNNEGDAIWWFNAKMRGGTTGNADILYNVVEEGGGKVSINSAYASQAELTLFPVYIERNTFLGRSDQYMVTDENGPWYWRYNVIVNDSSDPDHIDKTSINAPERLVIENNLTGVTSDGIVDAAGNLTPAYASYVGTHGHQR